MKGFSTLEIIATLSILACATLTVIDAELKSEQGIDWSYYHNLACRHALMTARAISSGLDNHLTISKNLPQGEGEVTGNGNHRKVVISWYDVNAGQRFCCTAWAS